MGRLVVALLLLTACPSHRAPPPTPPRPPGAPAPLITYKRVETAADMPPAPSPGTYQIHLIDVGTGLAILVRGADFTMLYDGGTNDREEKATRVVAYLEAALGASGDDLCGGQGD